MTSQAIPAVTRAHDGFRAGAKALLLALAMFCSQVASADPVVAEQYLQIAKLDYQLFKLYYQNGKVMAQSGQVQAAQANFQSAYVKSIQLSVDLQSLQAQNADTLQRGLCRDCNMQALALNYNNLASVEVAVMKAYMAQLIQSPTSQPVMQQIDIKVIQIDIDMMQLEQTMHAAQ